MSSISEPRRLLIQKKPTRRQLLMVLAELQGLIGNAKSFHANDRDPNGFENGQNCFSVAHDLCIDASGFDNQITKIKDIK